MNERIRELKMHAEALAYKEHKANCIKNGRDPSMPHANALNITFEKFAELLIHKCIAQIIEAIPDTECAAAGVAKTARIAAIARIMNHFGVE